jgi:4'-phosphopantetheinyl transferase
MSGPAIHRWPQDRAAALAALRERAAPVVLMLDTPQTVLREHARRQVRSALRELLADFIGCAPDAVPLASEPGQPLRLAGSNFGISVSHDAGISLVALDFRGALGIDVMRIEALPDWQQLARDYLGEAAYLVIEASAPAQRAQCFATAWTGMEARLKCLGLALTEWTPALQRELDRCSAVCFAPAPGIAACLAWRSDRCG